MWGRERERVREVREPIGREGENKGLREIERGRQGLEEGVERESLGREQRGQERGRERTRD